MHIPAIPLCLPDHPELHPHVSNHTEDPDGPKVLSSNTAALLCAPANCIPCISPGSHLIITKLGTLNDQHHPNGMRLHAHQSDHTEASILYNLLPYSPAALLVEPSDSIQCSSAVLSPNDSM